MAEFWYNDNGTPRKATQLWYNDNGTLRNIKEAWYNDNGTVRKVYSSFTPLNLSGFVSSMAGGSSKPASARLQFNTNGTITNISSSPGGNSSYTGGPSNWYTPTTTGIGASYYIRFTMLGGDNVGSYPNLGTIAALSTAANIECGAAEGEQLSAEVKVEIFSDSGGTSLIATGSIILEATGS